MDGFHRPNFHNSITSAIVESDSEIIGYGIVRLHSEAIMVLDLSKPKKARLAALELLMKEAIRACNEAEIGQLHVYVKDAKLQRLLERKFAFTEVKDKVLVLEV